MGLSTQYQHTEEFWVPCKFMRKFRNCKKGDDCIWMLPLWKTETHWQRARDEGVGDPFAHGQMSQIPPRAKDQRA